MIQWNTTAIVTETEVKFHCKRLTHSDINIAEFMWFKRSKKREIDKEAMIIFKWSLKRDQVASKRPKIL